MKEKKMIKLIWGIALFPFVFLVLMILIVNLGVFGSMPTFEDLENPKSMLATEIYSDDGNNNHVLLGTFHLENRSHVEYKDLSPYLVKALIATEDSRFDRHSGIDYKALGRVIVKTVMGADKKQGGGSTITQQLALNLFAERQSNKIKRTIQKLQEWVTAVKLERNYTKSEITAMYFNTVFYGSNAYGINSAAQTFFGKKPIDLNIEESALLVGVVNAPTYYSPVGNYEKSLERRNLVMYRMSERNYITKSEYDSLKNVPIKLNYKPIDHNSGLATYFREMLRQTMKMNKPVKENYKFKTNEEFVADSLQWEHNPIYGWCNKNLRNGRPYNIDRDGLKIYTTINSKMQKYAEEAVWEHLSKNLQPQFDEQRKYRKRFPFSNLVSESDVEESINRAMRSSERYKALSKAGISDDSIKRNFATECNMKVFVWDAKKGRPADADTIMSPRDSILYYKAFLRTAFMAMEPHTGYIRAYVGGPDFRYFKFDNTWQGRRQVGSTIKPFLYTLAMQEGMFPDDKVLNNRQFITLPNGEIWSPESGDKSYWGKEITLRTALSISSNNVSALLIQRLKPYPLVELCRSFGLTGHMDPVPAVCLGSSDMSLYEMVGAYNTYPSEGIHISPFFVTRIEDNYGNKLAEFTANKREVISKQTAYLVVSLMHGVVIGGTGSRVRNYITAENVAGKTGTTNKNSDGWFIGYLPKLTAGVWVGNDDRGSYLLGDGARMALPIWGMFMKKVIEDKTLGINSSDKFDIPSGVRTSSNFENAGDDYDEGDDLFF